MVVSKKNLKLIKLFNLIYMGKVTKGLVLSGMVGAGIAWLMTTKKGKELREQALDYAADVYERVYETVLESEAYAKLSRSKYLALVKEVATNYAKEKGVGENVRAMIVKLVNAQWGNIEKEVKRSKRKGKK